MDRKAKAKKRPRKSNRKGERRLDKNDYKAIRVTRRLRAVLPATQDRISRIAEVSRVIVTDLRKRFKWIRWLWVAVIVETFGPLYETRFIDEDAIDEDLKPEKQWFSTHVLRSVRKIEPDLQEAIARIHMLTEGRPARIVGLEITARSKYRPRYPK